MAKPKSQTRAETIFRNQGGILRTSEAISLGIHPRTLYAMRDLGAIVLVSRGVYRLSDLPELGNPDLVTVATRVKQGVICLESALLFHNISTQLPYQVHIALPRGAQRPRLAYPPIKVYRWSGEAYSAGIQRVAVDGVSVRIYNPAKTAVDCFRYRHQIGLDVALEVLREGWRDKKFTMDELWRYAKTRKVSKTIRPYLESLV